MVGKKWWMCCLLRLATSCHGVIDGAGDRRQAKAPAASVNRRRLSVDGLFTVWLTGLATSSGGGGPALIDGL